MSISAVLFLFIAIGTTGGALLEYPKDLNVTIGQRVILPCTTDLQLSVYWYFNGHEIFYGGRVAMSFQTKFTVPTEEKGVFNLVISSVDDSYNGEYICGDDEGQGERKSAHLYVTGEAVTVAGAESQGPTNGGNEHLVLIIVIAAVGVVAVLVAIAITVAVCFCKKRASKRKEALPHDEEAKGLQCEDSSESDERKEALPHDEEAKGLQCEERKEALPHDEEAKGLQCEDSSESDERKEALPHDEEAKRLQCEERKEALTHDEEAKGLQCEDGGATTADISLIDATSLGSVSVTKELYKDTGNARPLQFGRIYPTKKPNYTPNQLKPMPTKTP